MFILKGILIFFPPCLENHVKMETFRSAWPSIGARECERKEMNMPFTLQNYIFQHRFCFRQFGVHSTTFPR